MPPPAGMSPSLTPGTMTRSASPQRFTHQPGPAPRTAPAISPAMPEQPSGRWITPVPPNRPHRPARHRPHLTMQGPRIHLSSRNRRRQPQPPENLIRHPVPNPRKEFLLQQQCLQRRPRPPPQYLSHTIHPEPPRQYPRRQFPPPYRLSLRFLPNQPPKHPRIPENQHHPLHDQFQMIMPTTTPTRPRTLQPTRHPQMNPQPAPTRKAEQHLLPMQGHPLIHPTHQRRRQHQRITPTIHPRRFPHPHRHHPLPQPGIPLPRIPCNFRQLRHTHKERRAGSTCPPRKSSEARPV